MWIPGKVDLVEARITGIRSAVSFGLKTPSIPTYISFSYTTAMTKNVGDLVTLTDTNTNTDRPALVVAVLDQDGLSTNDPDLPQLNVLTVNPHDTRIDRHGRAPEYFDAVPHQDTNNSTPAYTPSHPNVYWK